MNEFPLPPATGTAHSTGDKRADKNACIVLVHSSDLHVDDPAMHRAYDGLVGLRAVLATARALHADVVLLAGDTFDNHRVSTPVLRQAAKVLAEEQLPGVFLPGNHDPAL